MSNQVVEKESWFGLEWGGKRNIPLVGKHANWIRIIKDNSYDIYMVCVQTAVELYRWNFRNFKYSLTSLKKKVAQILDYWLKIFKIFLSFSNKKYWNLALNFFIKGTKYKLAIFFQENNNLVLFFTYDKGCDWWNIPHLSWLFLKMIWSSF